MTNNLNVTELLSQSFQQADTAAANLPIEPLTKREIQVMRQLLDPSTSQAAVADFLAIEKKTLDHHLASIYSKLGEAGIRAAVQRFLLFYPEYLGEMLSYYITSPAAKN